VRYVKQIAIRRRLVLKGQLAPPAETNNLDA